jgi:hypothetical protein
VPVQQIRDEALRQVEKQVEKLKRRSESQESPEAGETPEVHERPIASILTKLESLKASSDEKLLSLLLVQRLEQLESEVADLKRRLELLEKKDDERY